MATGMLRETRRWACARAPGPHRAGAREPDRRGAGEPVRVKVGRLDGKVVNLAPEHGDCERAARRSGAPVKTVWAQALAAAHQEGP